MADDKIKEARAQRKKMHGLAQQRADNELFDVFIYEGNLLPGRAQTQDTPFQEIHPEIKPVAVSLHLSDAKRLMHREHNVKLSHIHFRFLNSKIRKSHKNERDIQRYGITRGELHNMIAARNQLRNIDTVLSTLIPEADTLERITNRPSRAFDDFYKVAAETSKHARSIAECIQQSIMRHEETLVKLGLTAHI